MLPTSIVLPVFFAVARVATAPAATAPFVVALDAGHGGSNLGAVGRDGLLEKEVTLALARRLGARLERAPELRVVMCRDRDVLVPIRARSRCASDARADLFVSLHANATPPGVAPGSQRGFELYVLPPDDVEDDANLAALDAPAVRGVWASHLVRASAARAVAAARAIDRRLREALGAGLSRGIRQSGAALDVLRGARAPAVLVEVGFLDSSADRLLVASPDGQERLAQALAAAVLDYRAAASR
ncbi:MAG TPA: N-acetylmuramoyl-L-alanine amidase [Polyangia bacterium]|nr:N-acetylmuramoyl-L-alanine amidase [Polyangia bacterium]